MKKQKQKVEQTFYSFLKGREQRFDWLIMAVSCIVGFIVLKICYPYPATISDSGTYVQAAADNMFSFYRPFGYSYFLKLLHGFSASIHAVFVVQMLLYFASAAAFAFVVKYVFPPKNNWLWRVLLFVFIFSPMAFYMANALMSDLLFATMIYFMLAAFIYLVKKGGWIPLCLFLLSLYFSLHVRYSAIMFPVLFIGFFFMVKGKLRWIGMAGTIVVAFVFFSQVKKSMRETTGFDQFSTGFDGWQVANNALHMIPYIDLDPKQIKDPEMAVLHQYILSQKDVIRTRTNDGKEIVASFMWINDMPLKQFLFMFVEHTKQPYPLCWIHLGSNNYKEYGQYLIAHYPVEFMRYYYLPNGKSVFYPTSQEIIGGYTPIGMKNVLEWYKIPEGTNMNARHNLYQNFVAEWSCLSYIFIWLLILALAVASVVMRKKLKWNDSTQSKAFWIIVGVGLLYYAATVFASPVSLRFWIPMNAVLFGVIYILANRLLAYWQERRLLNMKKENE